MSTELSLPLLRIARAREAFEKSGDLSDAFDEIEKDTWRWGNACPECHQLMTWKEAGHRGQFYCEEHGYMLHTVLLVAFPPIGGS